MGRRLAILGVLCAALTACSATPPRPVEGEGHIPDDDGRRVSATLILKSGERIEVRDLRVEDTGGAFDDERRLYVEFIPAEAPKPAKGERPTLDAIRLAALTEIAIGDEVGVRRELVMTGGGGLIRQGTVKRRMKLSGETDLGRAVVAIRDLERVELGAVEQRPTSRPASRPTD